MKRITDTYLKGRAFTRSHGGGDTDRWTVTEVYFDTGMREAHAVPVSVNGDQVELPVSHVKHPRWEPLYQVRLPRQGAAAESDGRRTLAGQLAGRPAAAAQCREQKGS